MKLHPDDLRAILAALNPGIRPDTCKVGGIPGGWAVGELFDDDDTRAALEPKP